MRVAAISLYLHDFSTCQISIIVVGNVVPNSLITKTGKRLDSFVS